MPAPNLNYADIVATSIESRTRQLADNVSVHSAILKRMQQRGNVKPFSGGYKIIQELQYAENQSFKWYNGYDTIDVQPQEIFSAAEYDFKMAALAILINGQELLANSGKEAFINLLESKIMNAEATFKNNLVRGIFSDGTGSQGKQLTGLQAAISTTPAVGTYGNISRAQWTFWRNQLYRGVADGGAAVTASNIQQYMLQLALRLVRNDDFPDFIVGDINFFTLYQNSLQPNYRVETNDSAGAGFKSLKYYAAGADMDVIFAGNGVGMPVNTMYFVNTKYLMLRPHSERNMVPIGGDRQPVNQDAISKLIGWAGNLTCSNLSLQGALVA